MTDPNDRPPSADLNPEAQRELISLSADFFWEMDEEFRFTSVSASEARGYHIDQSIYLGRRQWEVPAVGVDEAGWAQLREALDSHRPFRDFEVGRETAEKTVRWFRVSGNPVFDAERRFAGYRGISQDITELRHNAEEVRRMNARLRMLSDSNKALVRAVDESRLIEEVCRIAVQSGRYLTAWVGMAERDERRSIRIAAHAGAAQDYVSALGLTWADVPMGRGPTGTAIREGRTTLVRDVAGEANYAPWRQTAMSHGFRALCAIPLRVDGEVIGSLNLYATEPDAFAAEELALVDELAADLAFGIEILRHRARREAAETALQEGERTLRMLFDLLPVGLVLCRMDGTLVDLNPAYARILGRTVDEALGLTYWQITPEKYAAQEREQLAQIEATGSYGPYEKEYLRADGSTVWVRLSGRVVERGGERLIWSSAEDIDAVKRHEASLRRWEDIFRLAGWAVLVVDQDTGALVAANPAASRLYGYAPDELPRLRLADIFAPEQREQLAELVRRAQTEPTIAYESVHQRRDGSRFPVGVDVTVFVDGATGRTLRAANIRDLTEARRAEAALAESERRFRYLFHHNPLPMWVYDVETLRFLEVNDLACQHYGYSREEFLAMTLRDIRTRDDAEMLDAALRDRGAEAFGGEWRHLTRDGRRLDVAIWSRPIEYAGCAARLVLAEDISERVRVAAERDEIRERLVRILEGISDGFVALDRDWRYTYVNARAAALLGRPVGELVGRNIRELFPEGVGRPFLRACEQAMHTGEAAYLEEHFEPWGRWFENRIFPFADGLSVFFQDITERKCADRALRDSEERFRTLVGLLPHGVQESDLEGRVTFANPALERLHQCAPGSLIGLPVWEFVPDESGRAALRDYLAHLVRDDPRPSTYYGINRRSDGELIDVQVDWTYDRDSNGQLKGFISVITDVTERRRAEARLREYAERLQNLSRRLLAVQEEERRALARELHDEFGQTLAALKINLHTALRQASGSPVLDRLSECIAITDTVIAQVRGRALDLRPSVLDDLGLGAALEWFVGRQSGRGACAFTLDADLLPSRLPPDVEIAAFRIVQEASNNAIRHGRASRVDVGSKLGDDSLVVRIVDDGCGFDVDSAMRRSREGSGIGLPGMRERVELLGGEFEISSHPGAGTAVTATFPVEPGWPPGATAGMPGKPAGAGADSVEHSGQ